VLAVAQVTNPGLQIGRIVLLDGFTVSYNVSLATDGCPFATWSEKGQVDV
jgi:hypothetical protein